VDDAADPILATELTPTTRGTWLVTTDTSCHVWDLDNMTYQRLPGSRAPLLRFDQQMLAITRVECWPKVGQQSLIYYDDPNAPWLVEQWRLSATTIRIELLEDQAESQADV